MSVHFDCPSCKAKYEVADDLAGKMIMCRVCKKRGPVKSLSAAGITKTPSLAATAPASASISLSRRNFLPYVGVFVASLGAIGVGALLARPPWDRGDDRKDKRFRRPPPGDDKKDDKDNKDNKDNPV